MSKINDLIRKLCPNGVKHSTLEQETILNGFKQISAMELENMNKGFGTVKLLPSSRNYSWFCDVSEENKNMICCGKVITVGRARHPNIKYCDGQFISSQNHIIQSKDENRLMTKFLYYFLSNCVQDFYNTDSSYPLFTKADYNRHRIPIPPLDVQKEIIRIFDKFEELENELEEELDLRKKQYSFYLNKLLRNKGNVKISDVFKRVKGTPITAGKMKEISNEKGEIKIFAGGQTVVNANIDDIPNANICKNPCVIVQSRGVIDFIYYDKPFTFKNEMWAYTCDIKVTVKYLYYYLKNNVDYFRTIGTQMGSMPQISLPVTEKFEIDLPSIDEQRHIVNILDKFEELENELEEELDLRKKQYEYYRNKLLNFEEMNANV